jgi:hypothetical protein
LGDSPEDAWRFALNYAQVHGLTAGRDVIFTCGPLAYLLFPEHLGNNLQQGLLFQIALWLSMAAIFADLYFRAGIELRNLTLFSVCFGLAAPLFWFNFLGTENLLLGGALILMLIFHVRGGWIRYVAALALIGVLPMFKLTAAMVAVTALAGFLIERAIRLRWNALPMAVLAALVPVAMTIAISLWVMPSPFSILLYFRGGADVTSGYSAAMAYGSQRIGVPDGFQRVEIIEIIAALEAIAVLFIVLWLQAASSFRIARFHALLIAIPLFVSFKHGFVRQDDHIVNFFCFVALALALTSLTISLHGKTTQIVAYLMIPFLIIWQDNVVRVWGTSAITESTGVRAVKVMLGALRFDRLQRKLDWSTEAFPEDKRIEPELVSLIGDSPVASLSVNYTNVPAAHLQFKLYPVLERYSAYTPYLDNLNAAWIRDNGPRFLVFDGKAIDNRDPWEETPAMWLEIYRWYDTRLLGPRNLLLERRASPRFKSLEILGRFRIAFPGELQLPASRDPIFWTMNCQQNIRGRIRRLLFRVPEISSVAHETGGTTRSARIIPDVLVSPVLGYMPGTLSQFAAVFHPTVDPAYSVDRISFVGPGSASYDSSCQVEILRATR